ncbi:MAG: type I secretion C-terminal target domain-containing protein, partial [Desulfobulbaceae bacterium]|nr:type I secretion C-terminal target domain-containing protein [Desulfobulbaceae bacterium]
SIDAGDTIGQYLKVDIVGNNAVVSIDRDGNGTSFSWSTLITLNGAAAELTSLQAAHPESTPLAILLANHQIVV